MNSKGQTIVAAIALIAVFAILIPVLIFTLQNETKQTIKEKKTTSAFHAAEAGIDRAKWKLNETSYNWNTIINGGSFPGYTGTTPYDVYPDTFSDKPNSQYKVNILKNGPAAEVVIRSIGRDITNNEVRALEVVLVQNKIDSVLVVDGYIDWRPNLNIHWGPAVSYTSIALNNSSPHYPRKFSASMISPLDSDPAPLNTDNKEYWAFQDLGDKPRVDLGYYANLAKQSRVPIGLGTDRIKKVCGSGDPVADPLGSGYFTEGIKFSGNYNFSNSTSVIYSKGKIDFQARSFVDAQAIIAENEMDINGSNNNVAYLATVPPNAYLEYMAMPIAYAFPGASSTTCIINNCVAHGLLYCGNSFTNASGNGSLCGVLMVKENASVNTTTIYYDQNIATNIRLIKAGFRQKYWKEITAQW